MLGPYAARLVPAEDLAAISAPVLSLDLMAIVVAVTAFVICGLFLLVLLLASTGLAGVLTLMSAIASKAGGNFALMSILSLPVLMPLILVVIRLSKQAVDGIEWAGVSVSLLVALLALFFQKTATGRALAAADLLFVTDIYAAREKPIEGVFRCILYHPNH